MTRVEGRVAFITGAARGQGRAHAVRLAEEGADVIAVDACTSLPTVDYPMPSEHDLEETAELVRKTGRRAVTAVADIRDSAALARAVRAGVDELGRLDIVCANAGILSIGAVHELDDESWSDMIDINLTGQWRTLKATIPVLIEQGRGGSIIMTSSSAGVKGFPGLSHYTAAKHGVIGLMRSAANELAAHSIRVNALIPTNVDTDLIQNDGIYRLFRPDLESPGRDDLAEVASGLNILPIPWVETRDIANAVLFLASDEARYITGSPFFVDAGLHQK